LEIDFLFGYEFMQPRRCDAPYQTVSNPIDGHDFACLCRISGARTRDCDNGEARIPKQHLIHRSLFLWSALVRLNR
jgi:hypothetical protein